MEIDQLMIDQFMIIMGTFTASFVVALLWLAFFTPGEFE